MTNRPLFNEAGTQIATGFNRVVKGGRGTYVEFTLDQLDMRKFHIPESCMWRINNNYVYYIEYRSKDKAYTKLYYQLKTVKYADYKVGMYYISDKELRQHKLSIADVLEEIFEL